MNFRIGLVLTGIACVTGGAVLVACSGSTASTVDSGVPDSGASHDSGKPDTGKADSGKPDSGKPTPDAGKDVGTSQDAGSDVVTPSDGGGAVPTDAEVAACTASGTATCGLDEKCNPLGLSNAYGDAGTCIARLSANCEIGLLAPGTGSKASGTAACAAAEGSESCTTYLNADLPDGGCTPPIGPTAVGGGCSENAQCATSFCAIPSQSACGKCATAPAAGDSCADLASCGDGLVCYKQTCVAYTTAVSGPCSLTQPCGTGLSCVIPKEAGAGTCQVSGSTAGIACDPKLETAPGCYVAAGFYCVPAAAAMNAKTCQPIQTATAGQPCGSIDDVTDNCVKSSVCFKAAGDAGRACVARAADNTACNTVTGPACSPPARCLGAQVDGGTSGTCTLRTDVACP